jgi:hypothetical protein
MGVPGLQTWIDYLFDLPVGNPEWYWSREAQEWVGSRAEIPALIARRFNYGCTELPARFSDEQLNQGFWFLIRHSPPNFGLVFVDERIPIAARLRALRSFIPLFEQLMALRCTPQLSHLSTIANPLNSACYMWWDLLRFTLWDRYTGGVDREEPHDTELHRELIEIMTRLLSIPHEACRESALHGIGHLFRDCPACRRSLADVVDRFLVKTTDLTTERAEYAECAKVGDVM